MSVELFVCIARDPLHDSRSRRKNRKQDGKDGFFDGMSPTEKARVRHFICREVVADDFDATQGAGSWHNLLHNSS